MHRGNGPSHLLLIAGLLLLGCSGIQERVEQHRLERLVLQQQAMQQLDDFLAANPSPTELSDVTVFLSLETINSFLMQVQGHSGPLPGVEGAVLEITELQANFDEYIPQVLVRAHAKRDQLDVALKLVAQLIPVGITDGGSTATFQVAVREVDPDIRWTWFRFKLRGFLRDLVEAELSSYVAQLPRVSVPLRTSTAVNVPPKNIGVTLPAGDARIRGELRLPPLNLDTSYAIDRILTFPDGLHLYLSLTG